MLTHLKEIRTKGLILVFISRLLLFAFFQGLLALLFRSWKESEKYWLVTATLTNAVSIFALARLFKQEGLRYLSIFQLPKAGRKKDLLITAGLSLLSIPLVLLPSLLLSRLFWGNTLHYEQVLFQPVSLYLTYALIVLFPVTIALAELPTYFGYVLPRLKKRMRAKWLAVFLPILFLSIQHCTMPLVFDLRFILFRGLMYLPFAVMLGVAMNKRASLLPYLAFLHGLLDMLTVMMLLTNN
jgi:hypothetical protein